jgi:hypothetical protein
MASRQKRSGKEAKHLNDRPGKKHAFQILGFLQVYILRRGWILVDDHGLGVFVREPTSSRKPDNLVVLFLRP